MSRLCSTAAKMTFYALFATGLVTVFSCDTRRYSGRGVPAAYLKKQIHEARASIRRHTATRIHYLDLARWEFLSGSHASARELLKTCVREFADEQACLLLIAMLIYDDHSAEQILLEVPPTFNLVRSDNLLCVDIGDVQAQYGFVDSALVSYEYALSLFRTRWPAPELVPDESDWEDFPELARKITELRARRASGESSIGSKSALLRGEIEFKF